jgi:hypothetical protein
MCNIALNTEGEGRQSSGIDMRIKKRRRNGVDGDEVKQGL